MKKSFALNLRARRGTSESKGGKRPRYSLRNPSSRLIWTSMPTTVEEERGGRRRVLLLLLLLVLLLLLLLLLPRII